MITFTTRPKPHTRLDIATCEWNGTLWRSEAPSACTTLARTLIAAGCPEQPWQAADTAGNRILVGNSIRQLAQIEARETGSGIRWRKFTLDKPAKPVSKSL